MGLAEVQAELAEREFETVQEEVSSEAQSFRLFYSSPHYTKLKGNIEEALKDLDRTPITDPNALIAAQGQRQAFRHVLDLLEKRERAVARAITE